MPSAPLDLVSRLRDRWRQRFAAMPDVGERVIAAYDEPARVYHDLRHLDEVLTAIDLLVQPAAASLDVELAAWFHDAVYVVGASDNEAASAALAEVLLSPYLSTRTVREVTRLVLLTRDHRVEPDDVNGVLVCDADLAILARPGPEYDEYVARVRREYAAVPDEAFRVGRAAVLRQLLALPSLYSTAYAKATWEHPARQNLSRELATLGSDDER